MSEWHDNEAFWLEMAPVMFTPERWQQAEKEADQIVSLLELQSGSTVLDLGCGPGRHALALAERGMRVTGVDRTAAYLDAARTKADERGVKIEWVEADMRAFRREGAFDATVSMLTSFGYFADPQDDTRVMENILASLRSGGRAVLELIGTEILARIFRERDWSEPADGTLLLEERKVNDDWSRLECKWIVFQGDARREHQFSLNLYSAAQLKKLLADVGFTDIRVFGSLAPVPYDTKAERLVVAARKP